VRVIVHNGQQHGHKATKRDGKECGVLIYNVETTKGRIETKPLSPLKAHRGVEKGTSENNHHEEADLLKVPIRAPGVSSREHWQEASSMGLSANNPPLISIVRLTSLHHLQSASGGESLP